MKLARSSTMKWCAALCGALVFGAVTRASGAPKTWDLLLDVSPDKVLKYRLDSQSEGNYQGSTFVNTVAADVEIRPVAAAKNDDLLFLVSFVKVDASSRQGDKLAGQELGLDGQKAQVQVTTRGRVVKVLPQSQVDDMQQRLLENFANAFFIELPDKPVKVGDTWTIQLNKAGGGSGTGQYQLDSVASKQGTEVAKLAGQLTVESTSPALKGTGHVDAEIAVKGGYATSAKGSVELKGDGPSIVQSYALKLKP